MIWQKYKQGPHEQVGEDVVEETRGEGTGGHAYFIRRVGMGIIFKIDCLRTRMSTGQAGEGWRRGRRSCPTLEGCC